MTLSIGKNKHFFSGFTLIELLCVVLIISVLIAISTPRISATAKVFYFKNKAKQIEAIYEFIREKSVREDRSYKIFFDFGNSGISVSAENPATGEFVRVTDSLHGKIILPADFKIMPKSDEFSGNEIIFSPDGNIRDRKSVV